MKLILVFTFFALFFSSSSQGTPLKLDLVPSIFHKEKQETRQLLEKDQNEPISRVLGGITGGNGSIVPSNGQDEEDLSKDPYKVLSLKNSYNTEYLVQMYLGSEEETIPVLIDSGSGLLWMFSSRLSTASEIKYDCGKSISCQVVNHNEQTLKYGRMKFEAVETRNRVSFGKGTNDFAVVDQQVFLVTEESYNQMSGSGGMMGLSLQNMTENYLYKLFQLHKIPNMQFSFYLVYEYGFLNFGKSKFVLGGYDPDHLLNGKDTLLSTFSVLKDSHLWEVEVTDFRFFAKEDGKFTNVLTKKVKNKLENVSTAIIDSGTSLILIPLQQFNELISILKENYNLPCSQDARLLLFKCDCNKMSKRFDLPIFELDFKGNPNTTFTIGGEDILDSWCFLNIFHQTVHNNSWVLGDVFLRKYYVIHDMVERTVTIGEAKRPIHKSREWLFLLVVLVMTLGFGAALFFALLLALKRNVSYQNLSVFRSININPFRRVSSEQISPSVIEENSQNQIEGVQEMTGSVQNMPNLQENNNL